MTHCILIVLTQSNYTRRVRALRTIIKYLPNVIRLFFRLLPSWCCRPSFSYVPLYFLSGVWLTLATCYHLDLLTTFTVLTNTRETLSIFITTPSTKMMFGYSIGFLTGLTIIMVNVRVTSRTMLNVTLLWQVSCSKQPDLSVE